LIPLVPHTHHAPFTIRDKGHRAFRQILAVCSEFSALLADTRRKLEVLQLRNAQLLSRGADQDKAKHKSVEQTSSAI
jgi:hypothetical protein